VTYAFMDVISCTETGVFLFLLYAENLTDNIVVAVNYYLIVRDK